MLCSSYLQPTVTFPHCTSRGGPSPLQPSTPTAPGSPDIFWGLHHGQSHLSSLLHAPPPQLGKDKKTGSSLTRPISSTPWSGTSTEMKGWRTAALFKAETVALKGREGVNKSTQVLKDQPMFIEHLLGTRLRARCFRGLMSVSMILQGSMLQPNSLYTPHRQTTGPSAEWGSINQPIFLKLRWTL